MAAPFPEAQFEALIYVLLGSLLSVVIMLSIYIRHLHKQIEGPVLSLGFHNNEGPDFRIDNIGLSKRAQDVLNRILEEPCLQSDLPQDLGVSKATVSNAVSELRDRGLIKRKKRANTYLIEPDMDKLEEEQR